MTDTSTPLDRETIEILNGTRVVIRASAAEARQDLRSAASFASPR